MVLNKIRENKKKFLTTMILIIISATVVNYGIYSLLDIYFDTVSDIYTGVQMNMIYTIVVVGIVTVLMFLLLPKQSVNELYSELESGQKQKENRTDAQILQDIIDEEIEKKGEEIL